MNKKFSTLMAGLMLASAFSVADAQNVVEKYETNKTYWLGLEDNSSSGTKVDKVIAVVSNPSNPKYGQLILVGQDQLKNDINAVKAATWTIAFTQPTDGTAPKFTYVNKATGLTLSLDPDDAGEIAMIKGGSSEWLNTSITNNDKDGNINNGKTPFSFEYLRSFYEANKAVFLYDGGEAAIAGEDFFGTTKNDAIEYNVLKVGVSENTSDFKYNENSALAIAPAQPAIFPLNANDLNSQLGKLDLSVVSDEQKWFNLYFNQDVTEGAETNLFAATKLQAHQKTVKILRKDDGDEQAIPTKADGTVDEARLDDLIKAGYKEVDANTPYVKLMAKDNKSYIVVDTAYHAGTESVGELPKFTYAKSAYEGTNNVARNEKSFEFAFAYDPFNDRVLIKSHGYYTRERSMSKSPVKVTGADGNIAFTRWGFNADDLPAPSGQVTNAYVRLAKLASVREMTVASAEMPGDLVRTSDKRDCTALKDEEAKWTTGNSSLNMATTVKMSQDDLTFTPSTIADGLYLIKLHTSGYDKDGNKRKEANGDYLIASLAGNFGYAEQAKNQNYDHMPAAQWYVEKQGVSTTAPVKIMNREFFDNHQSIFGIDNNNIQLFNAGDGRVFFTGNDEFANDTLEFIPVSAASKADANLGYKYVDEKQASVETYYFNYLSGLAQDKGLNTPSDKDSLVRVDETGDKIALRLIPVVKDDSYGIQLDEKKTGIKNLVRNAYYIEAYDNLKFAADGRSRYLSYEPSSKKYVMSLVPEMFFLKENNDINGTHYYALVKAEGYGETIWTKDKDNNEWVSNDGAWNDEMLMLDVNGGYSGKVTTMYPAEYKGMSIVDDATKVWSFVELATKDKRKFSVNNVPVEVSNWLSPEQMKEVKVIFYDKDGEPIISDATEGVQLYAYMPNSNHVITLQPVTTGSPTKYYAMNPVYNGTTSFQYGIDFAGVPGNNFKANGNSLSWDYAETRISVDDNTLDLFIADLRNIGADIDWADELRVSAFEAQVNDSPLYRRFNGANGEYGTEANAPLNLKFFRQNNNAEYLFENYASENEYRDGINDKEISFLGVNNAFQFAESETRSYTMFVDTAYVRANTRMPQYLIGIRPEVVEGDTTLCDASTHQHATPEEALACEHSKINVGFTRAMYLFNAQDSVDVKNYDYQGKAAYGAQGYTRLAFKDAVHANDTLYILNPNVTTEELKACNLKNDKLFAKKIALGDNKHKNVVFQFRLVTDEDNRFLIESEAEENGKAVFNKDLKNVSVAPMRGGWVKIQNGVPVIARFDDFNEAIAQAEIFDVNDEIKYDATANDEIAVEGVTVVAGNGQVTIMGAAGKNVTITNILGKVIASQVIASDNATIAVPAGIVAVAVEGEDAVKAIVK